MSKRYAVINQEQKVVNIILWDGISQWNAPQGHTVIASDEAHMNDTYDNGVFIRGE